MRPTHAPRRPLVASSLAALATVAALTLAACNSDDDTTTTPAGPPTSFTATLSGANERPNAVNSAATGTATLTFTMTNGVATAATYSVTVNGLSGAPTASHIHAPADANSAAGVLVNFNPAAVTTGSGTFSGTLSQSDIRNAAVSMDSTLKLVRAGLAYVNVHTSANGGGEIRGQLVAKP